jgi:DNA-binding beta-propeller fold protein YncE
MNRRTFLKLSALSGGALTFGHLQWGLAQNEQRPLIVVVNAGDIQAGVATSVSVIDPSTYEVLGDFSVAQPYSFPATRWDFQRDLLWGWGDADNVVAVRLSTGEQVVDLPTGSSQNYTELTPDGRFVIVTARFADTYLKVGADPEQDDFGQVVAELHTYKGASPCDMTMTPDGRYAYAPDRGGDTLTTIRLDTFEQASQIRVEFRSGAALEPYMATASPTGNVLLVENAIVQGGSQTGSESIFDLSDPAKPVEVARLGARDGLGVGPINSGVSLDGRYGLVVCRDSSELSIIDTRSLSVVETVKFPDGSSPLTGTFVFDGEGETFFLPLPGRDAVAAVKVPSFEFEMIPVGARPMNAVYLKALLPERATTFAPRGIALASGRTFPAGCPDRCCGPV